MINSRTKHFENLLIFQQAKKIALQVYRLTREKPFANDFGLKSQVQRASVSVLSNIVEGYERGSNTEFIHFLFIAKGSCGEMRAQMILAFELEYLDGNSFEEITTNCRILSAMIVRLINHLKKSNYRGPKYNIPS
jgi:four helix bundle protein